MGFPPLFADFLSFETRVFGEPAPIARYDPYLIRYGEYRFILESIAPKRGDVILDLGCEANLRMFFLAVRGADVIGVDMDEGLTGLIEERRELVRQVTGVEPSLRFVVQDATKLDLPSDSVDTVIATSSIEHMYTDEANGDECAVASIAHVLKPGGFAAITVPMSNGGPFHEAPKGDARFAGPYRLYTPETIRERFLSNPDLEVVRHAYLAQTTPDPRYDDLRFAGFWHSFTEEEKLRWSWAYPILSGVFNPIVEAELGRRRESSLNTALVLLRKRPD